METKLFLGLGVITVICGVLLMVQHNFVSGAGGSIVGIWLVVDNWKKLKNKEQE